MELLHYLFQKKGVGVQPLLLEIWELFAEPFAKFDHPGPEILTTRPQVDLRIAYTNFLTAQGAV